MEDQDKYAKRIADLLRIAERGTDEEAKTAQEHAERLMARYGIDRAVAMSKGEQKNESIVTKRITLEGIYATAFFHGAASVGRQLNVQVVGNTGRSHGYLTFIGFESDVRDFETLFTSLMLQSMTSARKAMKGTAHAVYGTASDKFKFRRSHILGFFDGAAQRIASNRRQVFTETSGSELVVRSRMDQVEKRMNEMYPDLKASRGLTVTYGYGGGVEAGRNAMTGESQLKQKGQIGG